MITIKEIAQQAGFSPSTVSRLLSNDPHYLFHLKLNKKF